MLLTVSISILGFISLFLFAFYSSRRARSASSSIFEGGVLLKLIVIYQTLITVNYFRLSYSKGRRAVDKESSKEKQNSTTMVSTGVFH